jgi:hypothetical protein
MGGHRSSWIWVGRVIAVVVVACLAAYLFAVGLDKADKLASVLGLLVAVIALVAPYLLPPSDQDHSKSESTQSVTNAVVGGQLTQVRGTRGVKVHGSTAPLPNVTAAPATGQAPKAEGGQYVNGVWVGGNVTQVDGAAGDVTIG